MHDNYAQSRNWGNIIWGAEGGGGHKVSLLWHPYSPAKRLQKLEQECMT